MIRATLYKLQVNRDIRKMFFIAAGELVLIIVGIFLALQLDGWKKEEERQASEIEILEEIISGFDSDISDLDFNIMLHTHAVKSGNIILD